MTSIAKHPFQFFLFLLTSLLTPWNLIAMYLNKPECSTCKESLALGKHIIPLFLEPSYINVMSAALNINVFQI